MLVAIGEKKKTSTNCSFPMPWYKVLITNLHSYESAFKWKSKVNAKLYFKSCKSALTIFCEIVNYDLHWNSFIYYGLMSDTNEKLSIQSSTASTNIPTLLFQSSGFGYCFF